MRVRLTWYLLIPILLLSTFLGSVLLTYDALWFDEWITHFITNTGVIGADPDYFGETPVAAMPVCQDFLSHNSHSVIHTLCIAALDNSWPPLFFLMISLWDFIVGGSYYADRILALLIGVIGVSLTYRLGSELIDKKTGIIASVLLGTAVFFTFYMHEIRGYTLYATIPAINALLYWRLLKNPDSGKATAWGFFFSIAAMLYTHYVGIAVVFGIGLYHVLQERPDNLLAEMRLDEEERSAPVQHWMRITKLYINGCLTYGLWVAVLIISFINESSNPRGIGTFSLLWSMVQGFSNTLWFISIPAIALSLIQFQKREIRFLWIWGLSILGVAIIGNLAADFLFHPRHIVGLMPAFAILVAVGLVYIGSRSTDLLTWCIVAVWIGAGIFYALSTDFMNNIPQHIDAVPLSSMNTIEGTAETCGAETDTFVFGWNVPGEEWVQDRIIGYYLYDTPVAAITVSRIFDDEQVELHPGGLIPEEVALAGVDARYGYFVDDADRVFLFWLPDIPIEESMDMMASRLESDGFVRCEFVNRDDLVADIFVRDGEQCETVVASCGG